MQQLLQPKLKLAFGGFLGEPEGSPIRFDETSKNGNILMLPFFSTLSADKVCLSLDFSLVFQAAQCFWRKIKIGGQFFLWHSVEQVGMLS